MSLPCESNCKVYQQPGHTLDATDRFSSGPPTHYHCRSYSVDYLLGRPKRCCRMQSIHWHFLTRIENELFVCERLQRRSNVSDYLMSKSIYLKMAVLWVVVEIYRRFRGACCLHNSDDKRLSDYTAHQLTK